MQPPATSYWQSSGSSLIISDFDLIDDKTRDWKQELKTLKTETADGFCCLRKTECDMFHLLASIQI